MRDILVDFVPQDGRRRPNCRSVVFPKKSKNNGSIKCVQIKRLRPTQDARRVLNDFELTAHVEEAKPCPLYEEYESQHFLLLQFQKSCRRAVVEKVVRSGLWVQVEGEVTKTQYKFFGHSPTQLRSRHCVLYSADLERKYGSYERIISTFGTFSTINNVSKRAARIGLLLSTAKPAVELDDTQVELIEDIEHDNFKFTDGCGLISPDIAEKIEIYPIKHQYENQVYKFPSVYQIRFKGCKGVLMLDETLNNKIVLRKSLIKFAWNPHKTKNWLRIVEDGKAVSFPNSHSALNLQYIRLLSALGVPDSAFLRKLDTYFDELSRILEDQEVQVRHLCAHRRYDLAERVLTTNSVDAETRRELEHYRMTCRMSKPRTVQQWKHGVRDRSKEDKIKVILPLEKCRFVFGVADISEKLEYECCYFQPTIRGRPTVLEGVQVVVGKSPSYHVGDMRVLNCVNVPECRHLVDCLVFPVKGQLSIQINTLRYYKRFLVRLVYFARPR